MDVLVLARDGDREQRLGPRSLGPTPRALRRRPRSLPRPADLARQAGGAAARAALAAIRRPLPGQAREIVSLGRMALRCPGALGMASRRALRLPARARTTPAGVSGAVLLLPIQLSILHVPSPAVTPTNLLFNVAAVPGGLLRFWHERRLLNHLTGCSSPERCPA
jgi:hypothetical protein